MSRRKFAQAKKLATQNNWKWLPAEEYFKLKKAGQLPWQKDSTSNTPRFKNFKTKKKRNKTKSRRKYTNKNKLFTIYIRGEEQNEKITAPNSVIAKRLAKEKYHATQILAIED